MVNREEHQTGAKNLAIAAVAIAIPAIAVGIKSLRSFIKKRNAGKDDSLNEELNHQQSAQAVAEYVRSVKNRREQFVGDSACAVTAEEPADINRTPDKYSANFEGEVNREIYQLAERRRIPHLIHFTRVENLPFIISEGLLSNQRVRGFGRPVVDHDRFDKRPEYVCASISFPNYRMFYRLAQCNQEKWCILVINVKVLWEESCLFYPYNAASSDLSRKELLVLQGVEAFEKMFQDTVQGRRRDPALPCHYPTSPEAEVLIFNKVSPEDLVRVEFFSTESREANSKLLVENGLNSLVSSQYFNRRMDSSQWAT